MTTVTSQCAKFIDIDSTYRDRTQYPNPGDFVVKSATTTICGTVNGVTANDPVLNSFPILQFQGDITTTTGVFEGGTPSVPILSTGSVNPNADYRGALLVDLTLGQSAYITLYNQLTRAAVLAPNTFSDAWQATDQFSITDPSTAGSVFINGGSEFQQAFVGYFLYDVTINESRLITGYNAYTSIATLETPFSSGWAVTDSYEIRKDPNVFMRSTTNYISNSEVQILNPPTPELVGKYIRFTQVGSPVYNIVRRIVAYDPTTGMASITPFLGVVAVPLTTPNSFEIMIMSYDNSYFINGMSTCRLERGYYEIGLHCIIFPNQPILTGYGGRLAAYPYVYVEFGNLSNGVQNIIISNNPHSSRALFKVPIYDIQPRVNSVFLKINQVNMPQLIFFNPYEDYYFRVIMPNGDPFTIQPDTVSPLPPNPELQISVTFQVKRVSV